MLRIASLGIVMALSSAAPALASDADAPLARAPSDMTGDEIDAYNVGRAATSPDYIRCRRIEQIGSLVKKQRVCNTNAEWRRITDKGNQDARDTLEAVSRSFNNGQEPRDQSEPMIGRPR
ncbi:hypothetical protein L7H23_11920 [Sphingopyxis sp. BSN-002]|uniref:hypothetical protein n=1 Tax=Sphingopyxis sp. BSN-002 TaxID=2911495 RepID=UPI001EDC0199|nr:hypothetical protein [Sphingopyxis sp. BSN-002]UKK83269.1 hypothetical protein L7H23_11920 [Sphingopyxis sp. BSN-002]